MAGESQASLAAQMTQTHELSWRETPVSGLRLRHAEWLRMFLQSLR